MINIWLKIRTRHGHNQDANFVLRHLSFWLDTFSNRSKYKIWIYNEDFSIPAEYYSNLEGIETFNKQDLLKEERVKFIYDELQKENVISDWWKPTAFALAAPFFYFEEDQYIFNIDADDLWLEGNALDYIEKAYQFAVDQKLETFSYDILYSKNGFSQDLPNVWTFGLNISSTASMRKIILENLQNKSIQGQQMETINVGLNLDLLINKYLLNIDKPVCFITPDKLNHMEVNYTKYNEEKCQVEVMHHGAISLVDKLSKLEIIK